MDARTPQDHDDPLLQPTRARLFALLADLRRAAPTDELARLARVHPNSVRLHLGRLLDAGLVERISVGGARGRPRHEWRVAPGARPSGARPVAYRDLASWLARALEQGSADPGDIEEAAVPIGRELAPSGSAPPVQGFETALAALGFEPRTRVRGNRAQYRLGNCPYRAAVLAGQPIVCALHRGLARGMLEGMDAPLQLTGFEAKDPRRAGCLIEVGLEGGDG